MYDMAYTASSQPLPYIDCRRSERQLYHEGAALAFDAFNRHLTLVQHDDLFDNVPPDSTAANTLGFGAFDTLAALEQLRQLLCRNADPVIFD
jgi:hypothetical protein